MILLLRALSYLMPFLLAWLSFEQLKYPLTYPWIVGIGALALVMSMAAISWRRVSLKDVLEKMAPTLLMYVALAFALLLAEGRFAIWVILALVAGSTFVSLELLFLLVYHQTRYPVNGLSHLNIAYVPIVMWATASTSIGLVTFLHTPRVWHLALLTVTCILLYRATGHPGATVSQKRVWMFIGGCVGFHIGLLGLVLPLSMSMQGAIAALIASGCVRARRYVHEPRPSLQQAYAEFSACAVALILTLSTAKWL